MCNERSRRGKSLFGLCFKKGAISHILEILTRDVMLTSLSKDKFYRVLGVSLVNWRIGT